MPRIQLGSPYKTKDDIVYVQFWKYLPNGKREKEHIRVGVADDSCSCFHRRKLCSACKKKAQLKAAKIRETLTQVDFNPDASVTVRHYKQSFFAAKKQELNPSTIYNYEYLWRRYVEPAFGDKRLQDIRKADCMGLLRSAVAKAAQEERHSREQRYGALRRFLLHSSATQWTS